MSKENKADAYKTISHGEFDVYSAIKQQVEKLMPKGDLFGPAAKKFEKEKLTLLKQVEFEVTSLSGKLPDWVSKEGKQLVQKTWLALTEQSAIPRSGCDVEIRHPYGPIGVISAAMAKSEKYQAPKLEIHLTACPSYLKDDDWKKTAASSNPVYVYENIIWQKIKVLHDWISQFQLIDPKSHLVEGIYLHTPGPADLIYSDKFPGLLADFEKPKGRKSAEIHWLLTNTIASHCDLTLVPDVGYLLSEADRLGVNLKKMTDLIAAGEVAKFTQSQFIQDAYVKWGENVRSVLEVFYVGSVVGYGNPEASFDYDNPEPLKLFVNCETGGAITFAGGKTGVDFRHMFKDLGFHLALLIGSHAIRTPWMGKE